MLAQPILKGALCSPLMQLAAATAEPALASCKSARPAATRGTRLGRAKFILFMSAFSVRERHSPDQRPRHSPRRRGAARGPQPPMAYLRVSDPRFDKSTRPCLRDRIGRL